MLDLWVFRNPRFSVASLAVSGASFAMMAASFLLTQYLQFAHGYSALGAGAAMTPLALGLLLGRRQLAPQRRAVRHHQGPDDGAARRRHACSGRACSGRRTSAYWAIGLTIFGLALSLGNVLAPATESIMDSVAEEKAGVGSAMNDVTRQVAGALGVAVVGSIATTVYQDRLDSAMSGCAPGARETADGLGRRRERGRRAASARPRAASDRCRGERLHRGARHRPRRLGRGRDRRRGNRRLAAAPRDLPVAGTVPVPAAARPVRQLRHSPAGA